MEVSGAHISEKYKAIYIINKIPIMKGFKKLLFFINKSVYIN